MDRTVNHTQNTMYAKFKCIKMTQNEERGLMCKCIKLRGKSKPT